VIGIYKITNSINGKVYIGLSTNIEKRWNKHRSVMTNPKERNYKYPLYCAMRKYGIENFTFEVLEECKIC
jgi:group I intron endonuclease